MKLSENFLRAAITVAMLTIGAAMAPAEAQVNVTIDINPPPQRFEPVPSLRPGYVWAPGYWAWQGGNYTWVRGRQIAQRPGHRWVADQWEGKRYRAGYWAPQRGYDGRRDEGRRDERRRDDDRDERHEGKHKDKHGDGFCPPGQAKKGNC